MSEEWETWYLANGSTISSKPGESSSPYEIELQAYRERRWDTMADEDTRPKPETKTKKKRKPRKKYSFSGGGKKSGSVYVWFQGNPYDHTTIVRLDEGPEVLGRMIGFVIKQSSMTGTPFFLGEDERGRFVGEGSTHSQIGTSAHWLYLVHTGEIGVRQGDFTFTRSNDWPSWMDQVNEDQQMLVDEMVVGPAAKFASMAANLLREHGSEWRGERPNVLVAAAGMKGLSERELKKLRNYMDGILRKFDGGGR